MGTYDLLFLLLDYVRSCGTVLPIVEIEPSHSASVLQQLRQAPQQPNSQPARCVRNHWRTNLLQERTAALSVESWSCNQNYLPRQHFRLWKQPILPSAYNHNYGWRKMHITFANVKHRDVTYHSGGLAGSSTMFFLYPDLEAVAVALCNKGHLASPLIQMIVRMVENVFDLV